MYAVIFKARINNLDAEYLEMANRMRDLAISEYGCLEFTSCAEGDYEVAISYWESEDQIKKWKQDSQHLVAQQKGRSSWYTSYSVQVVKVIREYDYGT